MINSLRGAVVKTVLWTVVWGLSPFLHSNVTFADQEPTPCDVLELYDPDEVIPEGTFDSSDWSSAVSSLRPYYSDQCIGLKEGETKNLNFEFPLGGNLFIKLEKIQILNLSCEIVKGHVYWKNKRIVCDPAGVNCPFKFANALVYEVNDLNLLAIENFSDPIAFDRHLTVPQRWTRYTYSNMGHARICIYNNQCIDVGQEFERKTDYFEQIFTSRAREEIKTHVKNSDMAFLAPRCARQTNEVHREYWEHSGACGVEENTGIWVPVNNHPMGGVYIGHGRVSLWSHKRPSILGGAEFEWCNQNTWYDGTHGVWSQAAHVTRETENFWAYWSMPVEIQP